MSLREQFGPDMAEVFVNPDEFATWREFRISDGHGGFRVFTAKVVWDEEMAKTLQIVKAHGIYMGEVICFIKHEYLPRAPLAGELIYSPANKPWEVLDNTDEEDCYRLALSSTRSQPAYYGAN